MAKLLGYFGLKFTYSVVNQLCNNAIRSISFFGSKKKKKSPYVILRPTKDEYCDILELMWKSFHNDEPVSKSLEIANAPNPAIDEKTLETISQGLSYVAKCKYTGCIVGASLNEATCFWDSEQTNKFACSLSCKKTRDLYQFWAYLQQHPKIFEKYCVDNVFEIASVFVDRSNRGKGLAYDLMEKSKILGADAGFRIIRVDATSNQTAKICEKLKMELIDTLPYCAYISKEGFPVISPELPNTEVKIYIDRPHACLKKK